MRIFVQELKIILRLILLNTIKRKMKVKITQKKKIYINVWLIDIRKS